MQKTTTKTLQPTFWKLFWLFLKISFFSFGGGNAMFPMIRQYCVEKNKWVSDQDIDDILVITNSLPGASAVEGVMYISLLLLKSKWKAALVTSLSLLPHTLLFFVLFFLSNKYIPTEYLKIIYVAVIPVIIALLLNMSLRYLKINRNELPVTIHWLIFVITLSFSVLVPVPYCIPVFVIVFFVICLLVYKWIKNKKHKGKKND